MVTADFVAILSHLPSFITFLLTLFYMDCFSGVMVSMVVMSSEGKGFNPQPGQTKQFKIVISCWDYSKQVAFKC